MRLVEFFNMTEAETVNPKSLGWKRDQEGNWRRGDMVILYLRGSSADVDADPAGWEYALYTKNRHGQLQIVMADENLSVVLARADEIEGSDPEDLFP